MSQEVKFYKLEIGKRTLIKRLGGDEMGGRITHCVACRLLSYMNESVGFAVSCWKEGIPYQATIFTHPHCEDKGCEIACLIDRYMFPHSYIQQLNEGRIKFESLGDVVLPEWEIEKYNARSRGLGELILYKIRNNFHPFIQCIVAGIVLPLLFYFLIFLPVQAIFLTPQRNDELLKDVIEGIYYAMFVLPLLIFTSYLVYTFFWKRKQRQYYQLKNRTLSLQVQGG